jgi:hypothetical protein
MEAARQRARDQLGADLSGLTVLRHGRELSGGIFGFFQRERFVIELAEPASDGPRQRRSPSAVASPSPLEAAAAAPLPDRLSALLDSTTDTVGVCFDSELQGILDDAEAVVSDAASGAGIYVTTPTERYLPPSTMPPAPAPAPAPGSAPGPAVVSFSPPGMPGESFRERLAAAGLAEAYLPDPLFSAPALALPLRLGTIEAPAPVLRGEGEVLLLVGEVHESLAVAEQLAGKLDSDYDLLVVSHRRLPTTLERPRARTPLEAGTMVLERRLQGLTSLVVLDSASRAGFAPGVVAGLRPEAIWAVVPASWDERRARGLEAQLGRIDALVLYGLLATERPAGLIGRGWPVAYIDGWEATPLSIAARLVEAVEALDARSPFATPQAPAGREA